MSSLFELGDIITTDAVKGVLMSDHQDLISDLINRHMTCDFGDLTQDEVDQNYMALNDGEPIVSRYQVNGQDIYVITEHDRSYTTIMLCQEYA